ncbi:transmembrane protein, putative [Medicago truncatula]|uniref:Transmembrane protein, putative n=1 Tax=Medicago truncatula TaxID=3880 RepID=A0A072TXJ0_MEDTR|nr:transmembrane protein, putative [Medicago truncatula]
MTALVVFLVSCYQSRLVSITVSRPIDHNIFGILFILGLSSAISVMEVSFVSWIAAMIIAIFYGIILAWLVKSNWKVISNEDIVLTKEIKKFIAASFEGMLILSIDNFNSFKILELYFHKFVACKLVSFQFRKTTYKFYASHEHNPYDRDCEKGMNEESDTRYRDIAMSSMTLFLILVIFPILYNLSDDRNFMAKYNVVLTVFVVLLVSCFQIMLVSITRSRPIDNSVFGILFLLELSSATSIVEVSYLSWTAAIIVAIFWGITLAWLVKSNWEVISKEDIVFSEEIKKFIAIVSEGIKRFLAIIVVLYITCTFIFFITCTIRSIFDYFDL